MSTAQQIAEQIVGQIDWCAEAYGWCVCPGKDLHTSANGHRDCRVRCEKENGIAPGVYCQHTSCAAVCAERSHELRSALGKMELKEGIVREFKPSPPAPIEATFSQEALEKYTAKIAEKIDDEWLSKRSPIRPDTRTPASFLHALYKPGEKVIVFDVYESQGQHIWEHKDFPFDACELDQFCKGAKCGVWFLTNPVDGEYRTHPDNERGQSRRSAACVTAWRYLVIESDHETITRTQWLKVLVRLKLDIVAIYDTGGRLPHALVQLPRCATKERFDAMRDEWAPRLVMLGADPKTLSAVRLSRLAQCERLGKLDKDGTYQRFEKPRLQKLLYLCPPRARHLPKHLPENDGRYLPIIERRVYE
jgi:hypothetical protein